MMIRRVGLVLAALVLAAACGDAAGPTPSTRIQYASAAWEYLYAEPGYSEGLDSVQGQLLFERTGDTVRVGSDETVVGWFWTTGNADTVRGAALIWRADLELSGTVTPGDTFTFATASRDIWPAHGKYRTAGDSLFFALVDADSTHAFALRVRYQRRTQ